MISVSVMAHPSRERYFDYLRYRLGNVPFAVDTESEGVWPNCRRVWALGLERFAAPYHCVIQDDAVVCKDFYERAETVIRDAEREGRKANERFAINFYFGRRRKLLEIGERSLKTGFWLWRNPCWGVALCLRREWIRPMLDYCERLDTPKDDERIASFLRSKGVRTYFPVPSLVDHRPATETPSLVGDPGDSRVAYKFIDA